MNKKAKLFSAVVLGILLGALLYYSYPAVSGFLKGRVEQFKEYRRRAQIVDCVNNDMPSVTAVGVLFSENGDLAILISFVGTDKETMVLAYQHVIACAVELHDYEWANVHITDVMLQPVETLDDGKTHFRALIYDKMIVPRSSAEEIAAAPDAALAEKLFLDGINSRQIGYMNLYFFGFPVTSDLVNGDLDLAIRRYLAAVEALKGE